MRKIVMREVPEDRYLEANSASIKELVANGYSGVYLSFQRPFTNLATHFKKKGIPLGKLAFIDGISSRAEMPVPDAGCIMLPPDPDIDEIINAIVTSLHHLESDTCFVFVDSLTTITLYKPLSEVLRFAEFLTHTVKTSPGKSVLLIFNVGKAQAQKRFIRDVAMRVDEILSWDHGIC
jgi:uncharacterized protein YerC